MTRNAITITAIYLLLAPLLRADDWTNLKRHEYGGDQASLLAIERQVEDSMNDNAQQSAIAAKLLDVMTDPAATLAAKQHAGIMLRICGTEAEVPTLAAMLGKDKIGDFARGALERIPGTTASRALREAFGKLEGTALIAVINSTANRHDHMAVRALVDLTASGDTAVVAAAAHALGRIGGPEAATCLKKLADTGKAPQFAHDYLACGITALDKNDTEAADAIFITLADAKYPAAVRRAALNGQLMLSDTPATLLAAWLNGEDPNARRVALGNLQDQPATWLLDRMKDKPLAQAIPLAEALASHGNKAALPVLTEAAKKEEDQVLRARAISAIAKVGDRDSVSLLIDALDDAPVSRAATMVLCAMPSTLTEAAIVDGLNEHEGQIRKKLIDVVVARRMTAVVPLLLEFAKQKSDPALRDDVCSALIALGNEDVLSKLVAVILDVDAGKHRDKIETTYLEIAKKHDNTVQPILAAMSDDAMTIELLPVLGRVGGKQAQKQIEKALASTNGELRAAGIRALCNWPDATVTEKLADLVKGETDQGVRLSALRAYIRVVSLACNRPDKETLQMLQWAFGVAERPEEKNLVADRVSTVRTMETLRWLVKLLDDEIVSQEACQSIVDLAHHRGLRNPNRDEFVKALRQVIEISKDASTVSRAKGYIEGV